VAPEQADAGGVWTGVLVGEVVKVTGTVAVRVGVVGGTVEVNVTGMVAVRLGAKVTGIVGLSVGVKGTVVAVNVTGTVGVEVAQEIKQTTPLDKTGLIHGAIIAAMLVIALQGTLPTVPIQEIFPVRLSAGLEKAQVSRFPFWLKTTPGSPAKAAFE
jgi:hypothetical protein